MFFFEAGLPEGQECNVSWRSLFYLIFFLAILFYLDGKKRKIFFSESKKNKWLVWYFL